MKENKAEERNCKTCIHVNVCNKKGNFEKIKKEIGAIKLNDGSSLLEAEDFRVVVNCEYYNEDYNLFSYCNCLVRG